MKIGVVCGPLMLKNDLPAMCRWLAENGFDAVDMRTVDPEEKATIEAAGLQVGSFSAPSLGKTLDADVQRKSHHTRGGRPRPSPVRRGLHSPDCGVGVASSSRRTISSELMPSDSARKFVMIRCRSTG